MEGQGFDAELAQLLAALPERIARYRASDLTFLYCNEAKAEQYGRTPAELIGRPLSEVLPPEEFEAVRAHLARLGPDVPVVRQVNPLRRPGEPTRWIEWVERWHPRAGGADEVVSVGRDITEEYRRELAQLEVDTWFRIAMADAPIGMAVVGLDRRFLQVNAALCAFLGRSEEQLLALTTVDVTHPEDVQADLDLMVRTPDGGGADSLEQRFVRPDGAVVWGLLKISHVTDTDGEVRYIIGQVVDITDRVEREQQLQRAVAAEHNAVERLEELDRVKTAFLTAVSHELRTPLTVVRGMASTLRRLGESVDDGTRVSLELALERHAEQLSGLLDELLDLDRLTRGAHGVHRETLDLVTLVRDVAAGSPVAARTRVDAPPHLDTSVDRVQVHRVVSNLLDNVAKYAPQGPVDLRVTAVGDGGFRIEVVDRGPGIPAPEQDRVFDAFHRVDPDHPRPGTGIGLALVAEFVRLHGGSAWVEPSSSGAHLVVEVPAADA